MIASANRALPERGFRRPLSAVGNIASKGIAAESV